MAPRPYNITGWAQEMSDGTIIRPIWTMNQVPVSRRTKCYRGKIRRAKTRVTEASALKEGTGVGPKAQREYVGRMRERYVVANRREKGRLLDEAVAMTGRHRKGLIRAWHRISRPRRGRGSRRAICTDIL